MPLPAVLVAEFRMALTASCTADVGFEVEDPAVLEAPRSWLSDGEELLSKLDRSELIELVLIPILLRRRGTSHLCYRRDRHSHYPQSRVARCFDDALGSRHDLCCPSRCLLLFQPLWGCGKYHDVHPPV